MKRFYATVFDPELGLARPDGYFSGPRDCMTGRSTVFANTMIVLLGRLLDRADGLPRPLAGYDVAGAMRAQYWMGDAFRDSLCRTFPSGDANIWPFFFGIFDDRAMWRSAFGVLEANGFTRPDSAALLPAATARGRAAGAAVVHAELSGRPELDAARRPSTCTCSGRSIARGWSSTAPTWRR